MPGAFPHFRPATTHLYSTPPVYTRCARKTSEWLRVTARDLGPRPPYALAWTARTHFNPLISRLTDAPRVTGEFLYQGRETARNAIPDETTASIVGSAIILGNYERVRRTDRNKYPRADFLYA